MNRGRALWKLTWRWGSLGSFATVVWNSMVDFPGVCSTSDLSLCYASIGPVPTRRSVLFLLISDYNWLKNYHLKSNVVLLAESLRFSSAMSTLLAVAFVGICSGMAISALDAGKTHTPRLLPQLNGHTSFFDLFTAVPVIVTAFTFHFNGTWLALMCVSVCVCLQSISADNGFV